MTVRFLLCLPAVGRRTSATFLACTVLLSLAACGPASPPAPAGPTVTTVDGVRVVENSVPQWTTDDAWRLSDEPILTLGAEVGEPYEMFGNIRRPVQLGDGRIVVADSSNELRYFDAAGEFLFASGGSGQGPGEFITIGNSWLVPGDGLLIDNLNARNMLTFDAEGNYQATVELEPHGMEHRPARVVGVFGDGTLLARGVLWGDPVPAGQIAGTEQGLFRYLPDGTEPRFLGNFPNSEVSGEGRLVFPARAIVATHADRFYFSDARAAEIRAYDSDGNLVERIRWPAEVVEVSEAAKEEYFSTSRQNIEAFGGDPRAEASLAEVVFAPTVPLLQGMIIDEEGNIWALRHSGVAFPITYANLPGRNEPRAAIVDVFSAEGTWLGTIEFPAGIRPAQIGPDYVLAGGMGEDGVEHVWKYALIKP